MGFLYRSPRARWCRPARGERSRGCARHELRTNLHALRHWAARLWAPLAAAALFWLGFPPPSAAAVLEGYPSDASLVQGDTLELHLRSSFTTLHVSIWRMGQTLERVADGPFCDGRDYVLPSEVWEVGCGWPVACRVPVRPEWRPGAYLACVEAGSSVTWLPFVVRARVPGSYGPILVQLSTNTYQAYNKYGGKSLYGAWLPGLVGRAYRVSFDRPYSFFLTDGTGQFFLWDAPLIAFCEREGIAYEVCTNYDLHRFPGILTPYRLFVSSGHDEYWSKEMYDELERFVDSGGNLAFLSANTLWWQVRFENDGRTMVCYKDASLDPLLGVDNCRVTTNWHAQPVCRPPARLMGIHYNGSYGIDSGPYHVVNPNHWVFRGASVDSGLAFGDPMVAYEIDSRTSDSPPALELIARTELPDHDNGDVMRPAEMVYYERSPAYGYPSGRGGKVFACGTVNFVQGLDDFYNGWTKTRGRPDPIVRTVALNVLDRLGCSLGTPRLGSPPDEAVVHGARVLLQWLPPATHWTGSPVRYTVYWAMAGAAPESLVTDAPSAWAPVDADSAYTWWVRAESGCGGVSESAVWRFDIGKSTDSAGVGDRPQLATMREPEHLWIRFSLPAAADVQLGIYDVRGRRVRRFDPQHMLAGISWVDWDLRDAHRGLARSGVYFVRAVVGGDVLRVKVLIVR